MVKIINRLISTVSLCLIVSLMFSNVVLSLDSETINVEQFDEKNYFLGEIKIGETVTDDTNFEYLESDIFNNANQSLWDLSKKSGLNISAQQTINGHSVVKIHTTATKNKPDIYFWNEKNSSDRTSNGDLFIAEDFTLYRGISFYVNKSSNNKYKKLSVMIGKMYEGYWPSDKKGFYSYTLEFQRGSFEGRIYIPFSEFVNNEGTVFDQSSVLNFIAFKYQENGLTETDLYIGELALYNNTKIPDSSQLGYELNKNKKYEFVNSKLFNTAPTEMWNLAKKADMTFEVNSSVNNSELLKLHTCGTRNYPEIYFWNDVSAGGRVANGNLFGNVNVSKYQGIRLYFDKSEKNSYKKLTVMIGKMYTGYWPKDENGFYSYTIEFPKTDFSGFVYIPFSYFEDKKGNKLDSTKGVNFIGFKYASMGKFKTDIYVGKLALWREATASGPDIEPEVSFGIGEKLISSINYSFKKSVIFNSSDKEVWNKAKNNSCEVTCGIKDENHIPNDASTSIKIHTTGKETYPEIYFWNEKYSSGRATNGLLFGSNIDVNNYTGVRLWVDSDGKQYSTISIMIGKMYTGYWPKDSVGFYTYTLIISEGYKGYVNIPFKNFINLAGESLKPVDFNFIAFKYNESDNLQSDIYLSNLMLYSAKKIEYTDSLIGVSLDKRQKYELVHSKVFASASQKMWNQSKANDMTGTVHSKINGLDCVKISTMGNKQYPEIYYWNENSIKGRCTQGKFWGDLDTSLYDGIRLYINIDSSNTYSKLTIYLGQMYTGFWPKNDVGFYGYEFEIPEGGYEGYINIPFQYFKNLKGECLNATSLNYLGFKYNEPGFKKTDIYISDLTLFRQTNGGDKVSDDGEIVDGKYIVNDMRSDEYDDFESGANSKTNKNADNKTQNDNAKTIKYLKTIIIVSSAILIVLLSVIILLVVKRRRKSI